MNRTITVRGNGSVELKPDLTVIRLTIKTADLDYSKSVNEAGLMLEKLCAGLAEAGFEREDIKTAGFTVQSEYESRQDETGRFMTEFTGYACIHNLKLEFAFDMNLLSRVLSAVSKCIAKPELYIEFTVKDRDKAGESLLADAARNAAQKAAILAEASGVKLGQLMSVDYNWKNMNYSSDTSFSVEAKRMAMGEAAAMDMIPEDVKLSDSAVFTWEIL